MSDPAQILRAALRKRIHSKENYASRKAFLLETIDLVLQATGLTQGRLSHRFCGGPGHIKRWYRVEFDPTIEAKARVLELLSEELNKKTERFAVFAGGFAAAAILERDRQDPEGDVDTVEPTSGGSGE